MDARLLARVALRVVAIYLIAEGIMRIPSLVSIDTHTLDNMVSAITFSIIFAVGTLVPLVVGIVLWVLAPKAASWVVGADERSKSLEPVDAVDLQSLAFITIGVLILTQAVPNVLAQVAIYQFSDLPTGVPPFLHNYRFLAEVVRTMLGVGLIIGARYCAHLFRRFREFGLIPPNSK